MSSDKIPFFRKFSFVFQSAMGRMSRREVAVQGLQENHQTVFEHIQQLRSHALRAVVWLVIFSGICFGFMSPILNYLKQPYEFFLHSATNQGTQNLTSISIFEVMTVNFKICFFLGFAISLPFMVYELWKFVSPALYPSEKRLGFVVIMASIVLFYVGLSFGYFLIIPYFFQNALSWASHYATVMITYESYFNTLATMMVIFAVIFEVPVILSLLGLAGLLPSSVLSKNRRVAFLLCFILGAILAPPDVFSLCLVSLPMYLMVEISIFCLKRIEKNRG